MVVGFFWLWRNLFFRGGVFLKVIFGSFVNNIILFFRVWGGGGEIGVIIGKKIFLEVC